jgi:hypothetical protein
VTSAPGADSGRGGIGRLVASRALAQQTGRTPPGVKEVRSARPLVPYAILLRGTTLRPCSSTFEVASHGQWRCPSLPSRSSKRRCSHPRSRRAPGADSGRCGLRLSDTSRALARRRGGRRPGVKEVQATQPLVHYAILLSGTTLAPGSSTLAATSRSPGASLA